MKKIFSYLLKHKVYILIIILVLGAIGYWGWPKLFPSKETIRYVTAKVERGVLVSSLSGTGQVSASSQVDLKAKASGDVVYTNAEIGKEVKSGTVLASINARDALKAVRDAETSLETAKLELDKLLQPVDELTLFQSENSLTQAQESKQKAEDALPKAFEDGFNAVTNAFLNLPTVVTGLQDILLSNNYNPAQSNAEYYANYGTSFERNDDVKIWNYKVSVVNAYNTAKNKYDDVFIRYKSTYRSASDSDMEALISETYEMTKLVADAVKNADNYLDYIQNILVKYKVSIPATMTTHQSSLATYTSTANSHLSSLFSIQQTIKDAKAAIVTADRSIEEKTLSLAKTSASPDELEVRAKKIAIQQKEDALATARETLADYSARAPFDGVIAAFTIKKGDSISSGAAIGTLITKQKIATISLNEIDVAKVKVGQKTAITFDALEDLNITGEVVEVDTLGATSQGVVSYSVKTAFDVQDDRVKSGMSVSVSIILDSKPGVLMAPSTAIKKQNGASYVEVLINNAPEKKNVQVGVSNDTMTEVVSGLNEGEKVITQTISASSANSSPTNSGSKQGNGMRIPGMF